MPDGLGISDSESESIVDLNALPSSCPLPMTDYDSPEAVL